MLDDALLSERTYLGCEINTHRNVSGGGLTCKNSSSKCVRDFAAHVSGVRYPGVLRRTII